MRPYEQWVIHFAYSITNVRNMKQYVQHIPYIIWNLLYTCPHSICNMHISPYQNYVLFLQFGDFNLKPVRDLIVSFHCPSIDRTPAMSRQYCSGCRADHSDLCYSQCRDAMCSPSVRKLNKWENYWQLNLEHLNSFLLPQ